MTTGRFRFRPRIIRSIAWTLTLVGPLRGTAGWARALLRDGKAMPAVADDGLLTARQVAALPWKGTWLVVLSACDRRRGDPRDGESVLGLRRGFLAAGVENLLLSLWKVSDDETVEFMRDFYGRT